MVELSNHLVAGGGREARPEICGDSLECFRAFPTQMARDQVCGDADRGNDAEKDQLENEVVIVSRSSHTEYFV